jgi:hypothetical protein
MARFQKETGRSLGVSAGGMLITCFFAASAFAARAFLSDTVPPMDTKRAIDRCNRHGPIGIYIKSV